MPDQGVFCRICRELLFFFPFSFSFPRAAAAVCAPFFSQAKFPLFNI